VISTADKGVVNHAPLFRGDESQEVQAPSTSGDIEMRAFVNIEIELRAQ
jgi:hypothetical protein